MKKCQEETEDCRTKLGVITCAEKKGVKCPIVDYSPLKKGYMEVPNQ